MLAAPALPIMTRAERRDPSVNVGSINSIGAEKKLALYVARQGRPF